MAESSNASTTRAAGLVSLGAAASCFAILAFPILAGRFYLYDDLLTFHLPLRVFYARCLAAGDDFRWFPDYYAGIDLHGEGQIGLLHPLHLTLYHLLSPRFALPIEFVINYVVMCLGMVCFLRRWVNVPAALVGAIAFTFFGYSLLHFMHINSVAIVAHLPWMLWVVDRWFRDGSSPSPWLAAALGLLNASALLMGHPQTVWYIKLFELGYVLSLLLSERRWNRLVSYLIYSTLGVGLGAIQLLPTWETLVGSRRGHLGREGVLMGSLHPLNLTQLAAPYALLDRYVPTHGGAGLNRFVKLHELGVYQGAFMVPLLVWLGLAWPGLDSARKRLARWAMLMALLGLLLALGDYGPLGELLVRAPLVRSFRVPARYLLLVHGALAILASLAVDDFLRGGRRADHPGPRLCWLLLAPAASLASLLALRFWAWIDPAAVPLPGTISRIGFNLLLVSGCAGALALGARRPLLGLASLLTLAVADFAAYGFYFHLSDTMPRMADALNPRPKVPPIEPGQRLDIKLPRPGVTYSPRRADYRSGQLSMAGYRLTEGYVAFEPLRQLSYSTDPELRAAGVAWAWDDQLEGGSFRRVESPVPRAFLVSRVVVSSRPAALGEIADLTTTAVVDRPVELSPGPPGSVQILHDRPGRFEALADAPASRLLVWNEAHHPGWIARIDGQAAPILRANLDFQGLLVPPGTHKILFLYRPASFRLGAAISAASAASLALLILMHSARTRRKHPTSSPV